MLFVFGFVTGSSPPPPVGRSAPPVRFEPALVNVVQALNEGSRDSVDPRGAAGGRPELHSSSDTRTASSAVGIRRLRGLKRVRSPRDRFAPDAHRDPAPAEPGERVAH